MTGSGVSYRTIVADPPWSYPQGLGSIAGGPHKKERLAGVRRKGIYVRKPHPYCFLEVEEIAALPVADLAAADSNLFLWTTNRYLPEAFGVAEAWGFTYRQLVVWAKPRGGHPPFPATVAPNCAEFLLVCRRGRGAKLGARWDSNVVTVRRNPPTDGGRELPSHSAKPEVFLDLIEQVSPGPYLELFARRQRLGWDTWGDEALTHVEMEIA